MVDAIAQLSAVRAADFTPRQLSNLAWACAVLHHRVPALFDAVAREAAARLLDFDAQSLTTTAWALVTNPNPPQP